MKKDLPASLVELDALRQKGWRPQVVGCFLYKKKVLMLFAKKFNLWQFPQGGIENRQTIPQAFADEMIEELGGMFFATTDKKMIYLLTDEVAFPPSTKTKTILTTDDGQVMNLVGKRYYFFASQAQDPDIAIKKTEFDDYRWLAYDEARQMAMAIRQAGKQRVTLAAIETLADLDLLD